MFVEINDGCRLFVKLLGDAPGKPLLIVHHGAPGASSHAESEASFAFLADRYRVLVFDARGSGESDAQPPFTHARWAADVDALRCWAGAEETLVAGGSYGGFIALEYALAYPRHVRGVILRDTTAVGAPLVVNSINRALTSDKVHADADRVNRVFHGRLIDDDDMMQALLELLPLYAGDSKDAQQADPMQTVAAGEMKFRAATHNAAFSASLPSYDLRPRLGEIAAPTLITVGRLDWITPVACSEEMHALIPGSCLQIFEHSGHSPPSDEPDAFRATVRGFLDQHGI